MGWKLPLHTVTLAVLFILHGVLARVPTLRSKAAVATNIAAAVQGPPDVYHSQKLAFGIDVLPTSMSLTLSRVDTCNCVPDPGRCDAARGWGRPAGDRRRRTTGPGEVHAATAWHGRLRIGGRGMRGGAARGERPASTHPAHKLCATLCSLCSVLASPSNAMLSPTAGTCF